MVLIHLFITQLHPLSSTYVTNGIYVNEATEMNACVEEEIKPSTGR